MPRENSFSDSDGRSLTPDLELPGSGTPLPTPSRRQTPMSPTSPRTKRSSARPTFVAYRTPIDKFRATVRKVIQLHRMSTAIAGSRPIGAEPGIDPRRESAYMNWGHIRQNCEIEVIDYSSVRLKVQKMSNNEFVDMMDAEANDREPWTKVRWINIGGISWDVMSALAIKYDLHPLALEGILSNQSHARSKADYYLQHLFIRILCHTVQNDDIRVLDAHVNEQPRSASPVPMTPEDEREKELDDQVTIFGGSAPVSRFSTLGAKLGGILNHRSTGRSVDVEGAQLSRSRDTMSTNMRRRSTAPLRRPQWEEEKHVGTLREGERVNVKITPIYICLLRDGTVISIHSTPDLLFTGPIASRLRQRDTGLRATADPSLLVQSLLDLTVDSALQVVDEYQSKILKLEQAILLRPKMSTVRSLHIMSGDLILHKRTLQPIKTLVYGLRRYDRDRCAALVDTSTTDPVTGAPVKVHIEGYMSQKATIYLADVFDHMDQILTSLDMFSAIAENLINFTFNMVSNDMNEVMRRLTLATIIFLPLTFLTGYFGQNFEFMWSIKHGHSDIVFWIIALPLMSIVISIFLRGDVVKMIHYLKKKRYFTVRGMT